MSHGPVFQAYADCDALERACPNCGAVVNEWCCFPDGTPRHVPCLARSRKTTQ